MTGPSAPPNGSTSPAVTQRIIGQYVRDLSFQNLLVQNGLAGDKEQEVSVNVNVDFRKRSDDAQYEVITKLGVAGKSKSSGESLFLLEIDYAALVEIHGLTSEQLRPYLLVECPRITFPFLRRLVADMTQDAGFPPLILDRIDFASIYRKEQARHAHSGLGEGTQPTRLDS